MKGFKILIGVYITISIITLFQSCCEGEYIVTSEGRMTASVFNDSNEQVYIDTIKGKFDLQTYFKVQMAMNNVNNPFINSAMAFTCKETFLNSIEESSIELTVNKEFVINGDTIKENVNLLNQDIASIEMGSDFGLIETHFKAEFFDLVLIENGPCLFKCTAQTTDNILLTVEKELFIDL